MLDVEGQLGAVARAVRTEEVDGEPTHIQTIGQEYPSPIDDVWEAVTTGERIARWFLPVSGDLRLGGRYQLQGNAGGEVLACDPPRDGRASYRVTWEYGPGVTWLTVRLTAIADDRTRVELEHAARVADVPAGWWQQYGPGATGIGWDHGLLGLALHLGTQDVSIPPEEGAAWIASDEGARFTRGAADRWAAAHVAGGGDPEAAGRAADAAYGFFTGRDPNG
ncbi:SRPBCC domain-containing protein [Patulibacter defluvii]|uniref:SRPBCC domain-containing protein n=1 Tax=Patulibacter defluvii TaxID=3095358 RepID=UPI002A751861|nr:SRPBCC domain-containing protein [Patulibacter sp. DM4]